MNYALMKYLKLFSAITIILAVAIAPVSGVFAQSNVNAETTDKQIYKEQQKQIRDQIKEQKQNLKSDLNDLRNLRNDLVSTSDPEINVVSSLKFSGKVTGWAVIGGHAIPTTFDLTGEAGKIDQRGWKITGNTTAKIGDREVIFDLQGHARGNHVSLKGVTTEFDFVVLHLNGYFAPIYDEPGSFALAFHRSAIVNEAAQIRIPLVLVGQVDATPIGDTIPPTMDSVDPSEDLMALFS